MPYHVPRYIQLQHALHSATPLAARYVTCTLTIQALRWHHYRRFVKLFLSNSEAGERKILGLKEMETFAIHMKCWELVLKGVQGYPFKDMPCPYLVHRKKGKKRIRSWERSLNNASLRLLLIPKSHQSFLYLFPERLSLKMSCLHTIFLLVPLLPIVRQYQL